MQLTKHLHACVALDSAAGHLLIDPGVFTPDAAELVAASAAVLITHEHPDHFDEAVLTTAIADRPELAVYGPEAVVGRWEGRPGQVTAVAAGDRVEVEGFDVAVHGERHATVHPDVPAVANVGYLIGGTLYHPGDAYHVPPPGVTDLLLPTSGPWTKLELAVDYVRAVGARRVVQIHEALLSELGQASTARLLEPLTGTPLTVVAPGGSIEL